MHISALRLQRERFPITDNYPFNLEVLKNTETIKFDTPITFISGENGCGKTTLLKAFSRACGIYLWGESDRVRYRPSPLEGSLHNYLRVVWNNGIIPGSFFDAEVFVNFSRILDEWAVSDPGVLKYFGGASLVSKSHGQRNLTFFQHRFSRAGVYILDEPETALSPKSQIEFINLIRTCSEKHDAQFIIASHSPILLSIPEATILAMREHAIETIQYENTDYYLVYREFFENRDRYLQR